LIRMLLGLTPATAGTMRVLGRPVPHERGPALARVGAIVEEPRFHPFLTGRENLHIVATVRGPDAVARIDRALARVGLAARADERVKRYSLGMRQRLGVARALLGDPELLILDEPTNGLDPAGIREFREMIRGFVAEGRTVLLSSHLLDEVEKVCDFVTIVDRGRIVVQGSLADLKAGERRTILVATTDGVSAQAVLAAHRAVDELACNDGIIRVSLRGGVQLSMEEAAAELNRHLVNSGVSVHRLEPEAASLEQRFLEITTRLEESP
jgi:ABC-2 type transport system ATP-binding protein